VTLYKLKQRCKVGCLAFVGMASDPGCCCSDLQIGCIDWLADLFQISVGRVSRLTNDSACISMLAPTGADRSVGSVQMQEVRGSCDPGLG
jgi:hypothetical protein